jgi:hypothetical protein
MAWDLIAQPDSGHGQDEPPRAHLRLARDGTDAVTTVQIANGTARYELDLCQEHLDELTGAARRVRSRKATRGASSAKRRPAKRTVRAATATRGRRRARRTIDAAAVRDWARANGYTVNDRGRIPVSVEEAFTASR